MKLELLSPAKNLEQGREAIKHGADAVYIGAPAFGARTAAGNSIADIEALARYAHLYHAKVFATVNTLLFDDEIEDAVKMLHQLYNAGVDAAIIQDLGLLECDLPPIELHASTQTHNASIERIQFLEQVGFSRIILARETSLQQMAKIRQHTHAELEAFVQGALCVSYSGQCYLSQYINDRSGNRGCCSQPCRSAYNLYNEKGTLLRQDKHLLSLKDFSAAKYLRQMVEAGITSFKIEGRLKGLDYVKNVTAYYRQLLDQLIEGSNHTPSSSGRCKFYFVPDLEKTFNRGFTDYFLVNRQPMATLSTQKSIGKRLGKVTRLDRKSITLDSHEVLTPGDGLCFINSQGQWEGFLVNRVDSNTIYPNRMPNTITVGTILWRNNDHAFEHLLQGDSATRKIDLLMKLSETVNGIQLQMVDSDGCQSSVAVACAKELSLNPTKATEQTKRQLEKLGDSVFNAIKIDIDFAQPLFLPASTINQIRRQAVAQLEETRIEQHLANRGKSPTQTERKANTTTYYDKTVDYRANIINEHCRQFYLRHGAEIKEYGLEKTHDYKDKALMTARYCIRYELGCCLRIDYRKWRVPNPEAYKGHLYLRNGGNCFSLQFDCNNCQMSVLSTDYPHINSN
ncbi:MAG: U32 family peptidase [Bacteroidales bacterium]|nr:U32 family peptidase [Bacteroidales bacterium]